MSYILYHAIKILSTYIKNFLMICDKTLKQDTKLYASLDEKSHNWYNIAVSPILWQLYTFVSVLMYIRFVTKEGQDYSTDIKQSCPKRALLSRRKVRGSRVFKLVSVASTIQSPRTVIRPNIYSSLYCIRGVFRIFVYRQDMQTYILVQ